MLPFSKYMHRIWSRTKTPIIAVWVNVLFCACLGLIDLASFTAITAIFNVTLFFFCFTDYQVTAIAVDWSVCIPITCKVSLYGALTDSRLSGRSASPQGLFIRDVPRG